MATINLGKLRLDWRGDYSASATYVINDVVTYRQQQWICIQPTVAGTAPTNVSYWSAFASLFNNQGSWTNGAVYNVGDVVLYSTPGNLVASPATISGNYSLNRSVPQAYYCITAHTASNTGTVITPIDPAYWTPVNRKGVMGSQTATSSLTGNYYLGVYSNQNYGCSVLPNRGLAFDSSTPYYNGSTKNTTDSQTFGFVTMNGQAVSWGADVNGSNGMVGYHGLAENTLTFPFYDFWRSSTNSGAGVHSSPDGSMPRVIQWEKSYDRNIVLMNTGEVFSWGYGANGENGNGGTSSVNYPVRVGGTLAAVYAGTAGVLSGNNVYTSGHSLLNTRIKRISMSGATGYGVASTAHHCLALDENGQIWAWGYNAYGQLGIGGTYFGSGAVQTANQSIPVQIPRSYFATAANPTGQAVVGIWACGTQYGWSYAVTQDGNLWAWGYNASGQLGLGNTNTTYVPTQVTNVNNVGLTFGSVTTGNIIKIQALDNGSGTTNACAAILTSAGLVYTVGSNGSGWMGFGTAAVNLWTNVGGGPGASTNAVAKDMWLYGSGGSYASMMQRDRVTGLCWVAGYNASGQLGITGTSSSNTFVLSKVNIAGSTYNLQNVRQLGFVAFNTVCTASVVTDTGLVFSIGNNQVGQASVGLSGAATTANADTNSIELINVNVWQPVRGAPGMIGNAYDVMGWGTDATNYYMWMMWVSNDGRVMIAGKGQNSVGTEGGNAFGQYSSMRDNTHAITMTTPLVD